MITIDNHIEEGICELKVVGEIDASSSIHLDNALQDALNKHSKITIDLTELEYISSAGLGVFMSYLQLLEDENIQMVVFGMKKKVFEVFQILGLDQLLNITDTKADALAQLNNA
jgi:anti-sigma B factor antagonist